MDIFGRTICFLLVAALLFFLPSQYFKLNQKVLTHQIVQQKMEDFYEIIRDEKHLTLYQYNLFVHDLWSVCEKPQVSIETATPYFVQQGVEEYLGWELVNSEDILEKLITEEEFSMNAGDIVSLAVFLEDREFHIGGIVSE